MKIAITNWVTKMNDEGLFLEATNEVESGEKNLALWAKVMALSEGDKEKAKYKYINLRVEQLANDLNNITPKITKNTVDEFDLKYMLVAEFSKIKSISQSQVIEMIRDGFYVGRIKNKEWYISRAEVDTTDIPMSTLRAVNKIKYLKKEYIPVEEFSKYKDITTEKVIAMIRDGFYQGRIIDNSWYIAYSEESSVDDFPPSESEGFFSKLIQGDFGLPKTYWLFGVLGNLLFIVPIAVAVATGSMPILFALVVASVMYSLTIAVSIWRASNKYIGPTVWIILAKVAVILGILRTFIELISLYKL